MTHIEKIDAVWELYTTTSWWVTCYDIFTKAGNYRWGKIYSHAKKYVILSWICELTTEVDWKDVKQEISPKNGIFELWAEVPHIFYFPVDTRLIEWFPEETTHKHFEKYRAWKK